MDAVTMERAAAIVAEELERAADMPAHEVSRRLDSLERRLVDMRAPCAIISAVRETREIHDAAHAVALVRGTGRPLCEGGEA